jgi:tetratricopeptide (TPR) repeat protein
MLLFHGRYEEATELYRRVLTTDPNSEFAYRGLATARLWSGDPGGALPFIKLNIRRNPTNWNNYMQMGIALVHMRRPGEAVPLLQRAVGASPPGFANPLFLPLAYLASALALAGQTEQVQHVMAEVVRLRPRWTARAWDDRAHGASPLAEQLQYVTDGLRAAGLRDHVPEDAEYGLASDDALHSGVFGPTPTTVPGAKTIRTNELRELIGGPQKPIILDMNMKADGYTLPGATGIRAYRDFVGGSLDNAAQDHLRRWMLALTGGDLARPIVTVGWNAERWTARNVALRLVALGYTNVYWYRGGKEVWEANGLPEVPVAARLP